MNALLDEGISYVRRGWSVIPIVPGTKQPPRGFSWKPYQFRAPSESEINQWSKSYPNADVGIVTGAVSGLVVIDADGEAGCKSLEHLDLKINQGPVCATPRPGSHIYYAHPGGRIQNGVGLMPGIDLRADGGYVVAPKSLHVNGGNYEWLLPPTERALPVLPELIKTAFQTDHIGSFKNQMIPNGMRHICLFKAACGFVNDSRTFSHFRKRVLSLASMRCETALPSKELEYIVLQVWKYKFKSRQV